VSLDQPFPPERQPAPLINTIQQAVQVKVYMTANPHETCLSASKPLKIHRKRIAKLLKIIDALPPDFIETAKGYTTRKALHKLSVNRLMRLTSNASSMNLNNLLPKEEPNRAVITQIAH
jgi:hypothetical protein